MKESLEIQNLQAELSVLRQALEMEQKLGAERDELQREMDGIVRALRAVATTPTNGSTSVPLLETLRLLAAQARMKRLVLEDMRVELVALRADFDRINQKLSSDREQLGTATGRRQYLLSQIATLATNNEIEQMETSYEELQLLLKQQASLRDSIVLSEATAQEKTTAMAVRGQEVACSDSLAKLALNIQKSCSLLLQVVPILEQHGNDLNATWAHFAAMAVAQPDDDIFEHWPCHHQQGKITVHELKREIVRLTGLPIDSRKFETAMQPILALVDEDGMIDKSKLEQVSVMLLKRTTNRAERRKQKKKR